MWEKYYYSSTDYEIQVQDPSWTQNESFAFAVCFVDLYADVSEL